MQQLTADFLDRRLPGVGAASRSGSENECRSAAATLVACEEKLFGITGFEPEIHRGFDPELSS